MQDDSVGYIIDNYNKYARNKDVVRIFRHHGMDLCIRKITNFKWGQPVFQDRPIDDEYTIYYVYNTLEEAENYIAYLKSMEMQYEFNECFMGFSLY